VDADPGRTGMLETVAARFAEEDAARAEWLAARTGTGRRRANGWPSRRARTACAGCGMRSGHLPGCTERAVRVPVASGA
jgi:hypothetical protein